MKKIKTNPEIEQALIKPRFLSPKNTIVFVHGFNSDWKKHKDFFQKLTWGKLRCETHLFNFPNHGNSFKNDNFKFDDYVNFFIEYFKEKKLDNVILVGHSMGGGVIGCSYENIKNNVKAVILQDPLNKSIYSDLRERIKCTREKYDEINKCNNEEKRGVWELMKEAYANFVPNNPYFRKLIISLISPFNARRITKGFEKIDKPTLVVYGENDNIIPANASIDFFNKTIKNVKIAKIKNAAHSPFIQNRKDSIEVVRKFLSEIN